VTSARKIALIAGARLSTVAPWGAGFLAYALALAFWSLLIDARLAWSIGAAAVSLGIALLLARVVMRRKCSSGTLVIALVGIPVLTLVINAVFLFVLVISANI
jgi:hypothetical protein